MIDVSDILDMIDSSRVSGILDISDLKDMLVQWIYHIYFPFVNSLFCADCLPPPRPGVHPSWSVWYHLVPAAGGGVGVAGGGVEVGAELEVCGVTIITLQDLQTHLQQ